MQNKAKLFGFKINLSLLRVWSVIIILIILFFTSIFVLYSKGFRLQDNLAIGHLGKLEMTLPIKNTSIIVDDTKKIITTKDNELVSVELSPRTHNIIVSLDGYFPWAKKIIVPSNAAIKIEPMFITQNPAGEIITENNPKYWEIKNLIENMELPTKEKPITSTDGKVIVWLEENFIMSKIGDEIHTIIQPSTSVKNLQFYENKSKAVIFSTDTIVYAIEINTEGIQNFMPIYKGTNPYFIETDSNFIYILDGNLLMKVII